MKVLVEHDKIVEICKTMGEQITIDYMGKEPVVACVLKGACPFHSELIKHINLDMSVDYIQASSYQGTESTGKVIIKKDFDHSIEGKDVLLVEDIVDTGITMSTLVPMLMERKPKSIKVVTLLDKPSRRKVDFKADYVGMAIEDLFVIGFGLDLDEKYRNLKDIYIYNQD